MENEKLPERWSRIKLEEILSPVSKIDPSQKPEWSFEYIDISGIDNSFNKVASTKRYDGSSAPSRARQIVSEGDILFSTVRTYLKNVARVPGHLNGEVASTGFSVLRPSPALYTDFLFHYVLTPAFLNPLAELQRGSSYPAVLDRDVKSQTIPLPPLNEQRRIVEKIEELFSELEAGVESLRTARTQLGVYRQSLLKQAFEGKLTERWRAEHADELESADELLTRIRQEREARYQQQLSDWKSALSQWERDGKPGKKPSTPTKPKPVETISDRELKAYPILPETWSCTRLGESIVTIEAGKSFSCLERPPVGDEYGVAKVSAVTWGEYNENESKTCIDESKKNGHYLIRCGDFLMSRANTIDLVGACVIAKQTTKKIMLSDKTLRILFTTILPEFVLHYSRSRTGRTEIMKRSTGNQESMRNIGQDRVSSILFPLCSLAEQREIVRLLEEQFAVIEENEREIDAALERAEALRQSILKKAFAGELVPQDPDDEPASVLLERIRAEREAQAAKPARRHVARKPRRSPSAS